MADRFSVNFSTKRISDAILRGKRELTEGALKEYQAAGERVADEYGSAIAGTGRGGSYNAQMANINFKVTQPRSGGFFMRMGWFEPAGPRAEDGKTSWFVYQDTGYHLFGGAHFVKGLDLQVRYRSMLEDAIYDANVRIARRVERAIGGA